ncbi:xin actin-binding repeat-containing protein 2 [Osmerus mordax]|uniref:xin actin-binding repeat-containing protein 2 n=1 Tax=Osmerus mordax TaxID=8014 RepID=UPI00350FEC9C
MATDQTDAFSGVMEESEVCSLPGGLASVRKQFEAQETATTHNVTQFHVHHRSVQEVSSSEVTVRGNVRHVIPANQHIHFYQNDMATHEENNLTSSYDNHDQETEDDLPRLTTKELRDRFEKTIEEAAPSKKVKMERDVNRSQWSCNVSQKVSTGEMYEVSAREDSNQGVFDYEDAEYFPPPPPEESENLPPPPPDLLQLPSDSPDMPEEFYSPEPPEASYTSKQPMNREEYSKQRNLFELKRLYKHIHPEVRKNIEKEYHTDVSETQQLDCQEYMYYDDGSSPNNISISPDQEYLEWDEILHGEVQSMRWMFENKPLDAIKDELPEEDDDKKIAQQEIIVGKDVRRTAWMFETQPMDELGSHNTESTAYRNKFNKLDKGEVRAAAWLFETQPMETLNRRLGEQELTKELVFTEEDVNSTVYMVESQYMETLGHTETIDESHLLSLRSVLEEIKGEAKIVTSTFETQFTCVLMGQAAGQLLEIKSVRKVEMETHSSTTSRWLFDTQPLDMTAKTCTTVKLVCSLSLEDNNRSSWGRWLFETKTLDALNYDWESTKLQREEIVGADVRKHCMVFETQPMDSLKDDSNARPPTIEEVIGGNVRSARHFFETSPKSAAKNGLEVGKLKKALTHEEERGDVRHQKWLFETQPLEHIREEKKEVVRTVNLQEDLTQEDGTTVKANVRKNCWVFETQPMDTLKDDSNSKPSSKEEIISGNVRSARNYFETVPSDDLKDLAEVGKLQKMVALEEEKGDVRHQKWLFESQPLESIREEKKEVVRTVDLGEMNKGDVSNYKKIFETTDLSRKDESQKILVEGVTCGSVKSNKDLFESTTMYAMQDSSGHYHEVRTVRREEVVKGDVTSCKWMFETRPIDQFDESINNFQIIKGISKQEVESGDVKTAKWLFETQPLDAIKYFSNMEDEEDVGTAEKVDVVKGDVKTCKWLFETKPMDVLYERAEIKVEDESEEIHKGDVKTCTWLFETQALDTIRDETETVLKACTVKQDDVQGKDVRMACFLFETENLENLTGEEEGFKRITEIDVQSGDVSHMKCIFENQTSDIMTSTSKEVMHKLKSLQSEDIQKGNVVNCRWLFENQSIDTIRDSQDESISGRTVKDVQGGNVDKGRFIFETYTLDKIQEVSSETEETDITKMQKIVREDEEKGDVKNYTMMFETQPLYAIQDKEGHYHEVTTVTSEEVMRGDVVGSRWLFETKPLDSIRDTDEVYIIKSVTQEDVQKGDVTSAKWRFETQPLDRIAEDKKMFVKTVDDIQGGDVRMNKRRFESDDPAQTSVRTVNVSEIQKGDVRTAKWMFETQTIDKIRSMSSENIVETVMKEEVAKGDVKQSVWLFEKNPLDHIKEVDENGIFTREEIPKADVQTTTWLFETTPFHDFNETNTEKTEIVGKSIKGTLEELYSQKMVSSKGILLEADEIGDIRMAKYQLMNKQAPEIQKEEVIRGDMQSIMMNLLNRRDTRESGIVIDSEEKGNISTTVQQLFSQERDSTVEKEEIIRGDIQEAVSSLLKEGGSAKRGVLIQEDEKGDVRMTIYSLLNKQDDVSVEKEDIVRGNIKSALQSLSSLENSEQIRIKVDDSEKGNVNFFSTCIESGALDYLKQLQVGPDEVLPDKAQKEEIVGGDIKGTKLILGRSQAQIERTVEDIVPGDVHSTVKVFMTEPMVSLDGLQKEEIVRGDLRATMNSLSQSVNQSVVVEKEEVVKGNITKSLRCLEKAQKRYKEVEKPDIVRGNIKGALRSLELSATSRVENMVEDLVAGDVKGTLKSLAKATHLVKEVEKEEIVGGDIHSAMMCLQDASSDRRVFQQEIDVQGDVRGTIQLLLEAPASPRMQRRPSTEGDVKMSIRSLYDTQEIQEQGQSEKEEVLKGDVKGTIKSLLETAKREAPKIKIGAYRRVKTPVKAEIKATPVATTQSADAQRNVQKIRTANSSKTENSTVENHSHSTQSTISTTESQTTQQSATVVEHKTITQNHDIKTLKTEFRNLNSNRKGFIKLDKTKVKRGVYVPKPTLQESDLPMPPPPPSMSEHDNQCPTPPPPISDLPPPPTPPPAVDSELDALPPPPSPPPGTTEQDFLPPPPSQQELDSMPSQTPHPAPAKATKMIVKKVKAPVLQKVPKLGPQVQVQTNRMVQSATNTTTARTSVVETSQSQTESVGHSSKTFSSEIPMPPVSPCPLRNVCVSPVRFTPPPSPLPSIKAKSNMSRFTPPPSPPPSIKAKSNMSRFTTPLIKAEEKYRKLKDDDPSPATPGPVSTYDSVTAEPEMVSSEGAGTEQSKQSSVTFDFTQEMAKKTVTKVQSDTVSSKSSKRVKNSDTPSSTALITAVNVKNLPDSTVISSTKQHIVSNQSSKVASVQEITSFSSSTQQTFTEMKQQTASSSSQQSQSIETNKVQTSTSAVTKNDSIQTDKKEFKNLKTKGSDKSGVKKITEKAVASVKVTAKSELTTERKVKADKSLQSEDKKINDNLPVAEKVAHQPTKTENTITVKNVKMGKSPQSENKKINENEKVHNQPSITVTATQEAVVNAGKSAHKTRKSIKQDTQVEIKDTRQTSESEKEKVVVEKRVEKVSEPGVKQDTQTDLSAAPEAKDNQPPATPTPKRKKKKSRKPNGVTQAAPAEAAASVSEKSSSVSEKSSSVSEKSSSVSEKSSSVSEKSPSVSEKSSSVSEKSSSVSEKSPSVSEKSPSVSEKSLQNQEVTVIQMHAGVKEEHSKVHKEVLITESKVHQSFQQQETVTVQKQVKASQKKKGETGVKSKEGCKNVAVKVTDKPAQRQPVTMSTESTRDVQRQAEVQKLISHIIELQGATGKIDSKSVKTLLNTVPEWLMGSEEKSDLEEKASEHNMEKLIEIVQYVKKLTEATLTYLEGKGTVEKHECEQVSEKIVIGGTTQRISKISIGSAKVECQKKVVEKKKTSHESKKQETISVKLGDPRAPSPSLKMRPPSPTYITIESARRTDSPQRVTPSPTPLHRPATPPTPPPRRSDTPTSRINRVTPSPTFDRAENLARLKDTTAKLSRGVTPPPILPPQQITEKKSEIVESPASFHRQIKTETHVVKLSDTASDNTSVREESACFVDAQRRLGVDTDKPTDHLEQFTEGNASFRQTDSDATAETSDSSTVITSVRDKTEFFEEARKAKVNKTYVRKEPIDIPERLGPDTEEPETEHQEKEEDLLKVDLSGLVNKFETPEEKIYIRKEPIVIADRLGAEMEKPEADSEKPESLEDEMPTFDIRTIKNVFELGEASAAFKEEKNKQEELETASGSSKQEGPQGTEGSSRHGPPSPPRQDEVETKPAQPTGFSGTKSVTEQFSSVDEFGNKTVGSRCITTASQHSKTLSASPVPVSKTLSASPVPVSKTLSASPVPVPFSYADAVKRKAQELKAAEARAEASTEELLQNFHKTWTESENVFKSLGYNVSEERAAHVVSHQTVTTGSSSQVGAVYCVSEEGLSHGCSNSGQKKVP